MKTIMIPTTNELYEIPNYKKYELPNKVVDYIKQLEEENKNDYFVHMKEWAKTVGNNVKLRQIIDKAIEYINKLQNFKIKYVMLEEKELYASEKDFVKDLLDILRGETNGKGNN